MDEGGHRLLGGSQTDSLCAIDYRARAREQRASHGWTHREMPAQRATDGLSRTADRKER